MRRFYTPIRQTTWFVRARTAVQLCCRNDDMRTLRKLQSHRYRGVPLLQSKRLMSGVSLVTMLWIVILSVGPVRRTTLATKFSARR